MHFVYIDDKKPHDLKEGDMILHDNTFWRVIKNYSVLGYPAHCRRMLMILPHHFMEENRNSFKFLDITTEHRIPAYHKYE